MMEVCETQKCSKCGEDKPATEEHFYRNKKAKPHHKQFLAVCRVCHKAKMKVSNREQYAKRRGYYLAREYQKIDRRSGYENNITEEWFNENIEGQPCTYCGDADEAMGCDRIDNNLGHTMENVVPCCHTCNKTRNNLFTHDEMIILGETIRKIKFARL